MKQRWLLLLIAANLVALVALIFVYPHLMVSPGPVITAHADIATDCFACHAPLRGASVERCVSCHALTDIGRRTSKGVPIVAARPLASGGVTKSAIRSSFHQELLEQDCMACHSDHQGPKLTQRSRKPFSHELLRPASRDVCQTCHVAPKDSLHRNVNDTCAKCHSNKNWKPATFDHDKLFALDRDHDVECVTCHVKSDFSRYTCYGCHEHTPDKIRREHEEEGIRRFENCVECHRNARDEPERKGSSGGRERD